MALLLACSGFADPPSGYYDEAEGLSGDDLRGTLHSIIDDHVRYPYTSSTGVDTWDIVHLADEDPNDPDRVIDVYRNRSFSKLDHWSDQNRDGWNREHSWPKSYGFTFLDDCNSAYTDVHHLFASDPAYNEARSNLPFDWVPSGGTPYPVDHLGFANFAIGQYENGGWEVWPLRRGDIARAMFYMDLRYEGGKGESGCDEPDLRLTNDRSQFVWSGSVNLPVAYMGILKTLLEWHFEDPVDDHERYRHEVVFEFQGNRNPFIDHPEWVCLVYSCEGLDVELFLRAVRVSMTPRVVDLEWTGALSEWVDVYRDDEMIATTKNDGRYQDEAGAAGPGRFSYLYQVCEAGTSRCSNQVRVGFAGRRRGARP